MFLHRVAAGLLCMMGLVVSRVAVIEESWPVLLLGLAASGAGMVWFASARRTADDATPLPNPLATR